MKCANCGAEIEDGAKFCGECGAAVPQVKKCVVCGAEISLKMKFCPECGARQDEGVKKTSGGGLSMGDKNVIAGDVVGKQEVTNVSGNATIIKNEDETKKTARCHVCGRIVLRMDGYECLNCGEFTCADCYDKSTKMCRSCVSENEKTYRERLESILSKGSISLEDRNNLLNLQNHLHISPERAERIEAEVKNKSDGDNLTQSEVLELDNAENLFYGSGNSSEALRLVEPIYKKNPNSEKVLGLYLSILSEADSRKAKSAISSLKFDSAPAFAVAAKIAMQNGDFDGAERALERAKKNWPEDAVASSLGVCLKIALWEKSKDFELLNEANQELKNISVRDDDRVAKTWKAKAKLLLENPGNQDALEKVSNDACEESGLYFHLMQEKLWGGKRKVVVGKDSLSDFSSIQQAIDSVPEDSIVSVKPGVYKENLVFTKKVCLAGSTDSIFQKSSAELPVVVFDKSKPCALDAPVEIEGIVFTHNENLKFDNLKNFAGEKKEFAGLSDFSSPNLDDANFSSLFVVKSESSFKNIGVLGSAGCGITFKGGKAELSNSVIFHCADSGIFCAKNAEPVISGTTVSGCFKQGVEMAGSSNPYFEKCEICGNLSSGIWLKEEARGKFENCRIFNNDDCGVDAGGSSETFFASCEICRNFGNGVNLKGTSKLDFESCWIHENCGGSSDSFPGVAVQDKARPVFQMCEISDHASNGIYIKDSAGGTYANCNIHGNGWTPEFCNEGNGSVNCK